MAEVSGRSNHGRAGQSRRSFLQLGTLGAVGLTLGDFLRLRAASPTVSRSDKDSAVIFVWLDGGPSHLETWDPKPAAPAEYRGDFQAIPTKLPGVRLCELLPRQAQVADKLAIIRSCAHTNTDHGGSRGLCHWGYDIPGNNSPELGRNPYPSIGSVTAKVRGPNRAALPPYVTVPSPILYGQGGASYLGKAYDAFVPGAGLTLQRHPQVSLDRLQDRKALLAQFDCLRRDLDRSGAVEGMDIFAQQALEIIGGQAAAEAFDLRHEPQAVRDRYGKEGTAFLTARRLVEAGVTFVTVNLQAWDDHAALPDKLRGRLPRVDHNVATLIEDLHERGLDRRITVVVWGEFGRTPRINKEAGRDHWPHAMSVVLAGGGLKVGQVVGATDSRGALPTERPLHPNDVLATLYHQLGIDYHQQFVNTAGRPISILPHGQPIAELL